MSDGPQFAITFPPHYTPAQCRDMGERIRAALAAGRAITIPKDVDVTVINNAPVEPSWAPPVVITPLWEPVPTQCSRCGAMFTPAAQNQWTCFDCREKESAKRQAEAERARTARRCVKPGCANDRSNGFDICYEHQRMAILAAQGAREDTTLKPEFIGQRKITLEDD